MSYGSQAYAAALAEFGTPRWLRHSQGWVLIRNIPGFGSSSDSLRDAVGCYPLFTCENWRNLAADLAELKEEGLVSLTVVTDPWGDHHPSGLSRSFGHLTRRYKQHYVTDLKLAPEQVVSAHHRRNARRFLRHARVEICPQPSDHLDDWCRLYAELVQRHHIVGMARFSRQSFSRQLALPETVLLRAVTDDGRLAGMQIWLNNGHTVQHHLSAYGPLGYHWGGASYGLLQHALDHFRRSGLRWASLGSGSGLDHDPTDGLSRFKQGWATDVRWSWLCGAILDASRYHQLSGERLADETTFFPAYRAPGSASASTARGRTHAHAS